MTSHIPGVATDDNFEKEVLQNDKPVLIDFWAPWCGPCKAIGPIVEEVATEYADSVKVMKMNVDDNAKIAAKYGIRGIPTILLFKEGKLADTLVGLVPKEKLVEFVKKSL